MQSRQSRMDKYYENVVDEETTVKSSRIKKNEKLYKEVSNLELEDFDLNSNVSVIGDNTDNISLDEIKDILDKKYRENPRKKSFGDTDELSLPEIHLDETREYDINSILEKAKEKKEVNYEEDRLKKIRNTQYDILKSLDIMNGEEEIEETEEPEKPTDRRPAPNHVESEKKLLDLIDTITAKELIDNEENLQVSGELDPLDILSDLRGDDESTKVMGMLEEELKAAQDENENIKKESTLGILASSTIEEESSTESTTEQSVTKEEIKEELLKEKKESKKDKKLKLDDSFVGKTTTFTQSDFDDFNDLKEDMHVTKIVIRLLIIIIILVFIIGLVVLANKYLELGLF